jgi:hypothetical protein
VDIVQRKLIWLLASHKGCNGFKRIFGKTFRREDTDAGAMLA